MIEWNNYTHILNKILSAVSGLVLVETTFTEILWKHSTNGEELIWIIMYQCIFLLHSSIALPSSIYWASLLLLSEIVLLFSFIVKKRNFFFEGWKDLQMKAIFINLILFHEHFFILLEIFLSRIFFRLPNLNFSSSIASSKLLYFQLKEEKTLLKRKSKCNLNYLLMSSSLI